MLLEHKNSVVHQIEGIAVASFFYEGKKPIKKIDENSVISPVYSELDFVFRKLNYGGISRKRFLEK